MNKFDIFFDKIQSLTKISKENWSNLFWSNISQFVIKFAELLASVLIARIAGKDFYGQYLICLSVFGLMSIFSIPGIFSLIFIETAKGFYSIYNKGTKFSLKWSVLGIPVLWGTGLYYYLHAGEKEIGTAIIITSFFFPFFSTYQGWLSFLKGSKKFKKLSKYNFYKNIIVLSGVAITTLLSRNIIYTIVVYFFLTSLVHIFFHRKISKESASYKDKYVNNGWKKNSYNLSLLNLSYLMFEKIDILLVSFFLSNSKVAIYGLVMSLIGIFFRFIYSSIESMVPKIIKDDIDHRFFYKFFFASFLIPIVLVFIIHYPVLILYGEEYSEVIKYARIYVFAIPFYFLSHVYNSFLYKKEMYNELNIIKIASSLSVILLYSITIPIWGLYGGVVSSISYFIFECILKIYFIKRKERKVKI